MRGWNKFIYPMILALLEISISGCGKKEAPPEPKVFSAGGVFVRVIDFDGQAEFRMNNLLFNESANCAKLYQLGSSYYIEFLKGSCAAGEVTLTVEVASSGLVSRGAKNIGFYDFNAGDLLQLCSGSTYSSVCTPVITNGYLSDIIVH